jgi:benzoylsuccinyl-CoA thiolase BbsB subunit
MTTQRLLSGLKLAYEMAGLGSKDIDVAEVHDAFSIAELLYYEALGFVNMVRPLNYLRRGNKHRWSYPH